MAIATTNPATGETIREFVKLTVEQVEEKLARGRGVPRVAHEQLSPTAPP